MKSLCTLLLLTTLFACTSETKPADKEIIENQLDLKNYASFDLAPFQIPTHLYLPNDESLIGGSVEPEVEHVEDSFTWKIKSGKNFIMKIEDFGEKNGLELYKVNLNNFKDMFTYEIMEDSANVLVYKKTLKKKESEEMTHYSYHCVGNINAEGINYLISSRTEGFEKPVIDIMYTTIAEAARRKDQ